MAREPAQMRFDRIVLFRLRACIDLGQDAPSALIKDAITALAAHADAATRRQLRDARVVAAAGELPEGSLDAKAKMLEALIVRMDRVHTKTAAVELLREAAEFHPLPDSARQLLRILQTQGSGDTLPHGDVTGNAESM